ncbi:hypothetical protein TNCV_819771 [Trichonephila clavipes]|nr:hypothetical protein TNCV_819771 [Trichonephila clavipes]
MRGIKRSLIEKVAWSAMPTESPKQPCDGCPATNIRSLVGDMISHDCWAGFTANCPCYEKRGVNEVFEALLPIRLAAPIEAPESLLVVRYELPSVCLENPIHARWD